MNPQGEVVPEDDGPDARPAGPRQGNKRIQAKFGRQRSHNEQIIVAPCGVIIARTTFFGSEAPSKVKVRAPLCKNVTWDATIEDCFPGLPQTGVWTKQSSPAHCLL